MSNTDTRMLGPGGAPTRTTILPKEAKERKKFPVGSGVLDYFPDAIVAVAEVSYVGNEQHNPGQPLHWNRGKSGDESDTMIRHYLQRGLRDTDGVRHSAKMVWRALAYLQKEIENEQERQRLETVQKSTIDKPERCSGSYDCGGTKCDGYISDVEMPPF